MLISEKSILLSIESLLAWYKKNKRPDLPWRKYPLSGYEIWVSEIFLQQTQVSRVIPFYTRFLQKYPTVESLSVSNWEEFFPYYEGLGYYQRGRNMLKTAKIVCETYDGIFPDNKKELESLPGIGPYTASAILSFAYNQSFLSVDANLKKVYKRFFLGSSVFEIPWDRFEKILEKQKYHFADINNASMDFAALQCTKSPNCDDCPMVKKCLFAQGDRVIEKKQKKQIVPKEKKKVVLFLHENHKKYFSSHADVYTPFYFSFPIYNRESIKKYFEETYHLKLSIRPPYKKVIEDDYEVSYVNAQIQVGEHQFAEFLPEAL